MAGAFREEAVSPEDAEDGAEAPEGGNEGMKFNKDKFRKIRESKMTGAVLAERMGVTRSAVTQWETGAAAPSPQKFSELARVLDCSIADFCDEDNAATSRRTDIEDDGLFESIQSAWPGLRTREKTRLLCCLVDIFKSRADAAEAKEREAKARAQEAENRLANAQDGLCKSQAAENETLNGGEAPGSKE